VYLDITVQPKELLCLKFVPEASSVLSAKIKHSTVRLAITVLLILKDQRFVHLVFTVLVQLTSILSVRLAHTVLKALKLQLNVPMGCMVLEMMITLTLRVVA
jgi:hypothetical protein